MRLVLLGPPGAGKGTQAAILSEKLGVPHISTGDLFRANIGEGTPLGVEAKSYIDAGKLVPTDVTARMVEDRLNQDDAKDGFLLDGFPRTLPQADALEDLLSGMGRGIDAVIEMQVDDTALVDRISGRFTCGNCGEVYHDQTKPTAKPGVCDVCGSTDLKRRADDNADSLKTRLLEYYKKTSPLIGYYYAKKQLHPVDGMAEMDAVGRQVAGIMDGLKG